MKYDRRHDSARAAPAHTLLVSCPNEGGLVALGPDGCEIVDGYDTVGMFADERLFVRAYQTQDGCHLDIFEDDGLRTLFLPEVADIHDVFVQGDVLHAVSTGTNEILSYDFTSGRLLERIAYPGRGDAHHLNCLGRMQGRVVVSAFGRFAENRGWEAGRSAGSGMVVDLRDTRAERPLFDGLDQPHTPCEHAGWSYVCDSRNNRLLRVRGDRRESLDFPGGYVRGLGFAGDRLYVGLSASRNQRSEYTKARVATVDLGTFSTLSHIELPFAEVFAIAPVGDRILDSVRRHCRRHDVPSAAARFNPLDRPVCFLRPDHLPPVESWTQHIPFAFVATELCKPLVMVELGTQCGTSYLAFCQAVARLRLPTRCAAVDTWRGDDHAGYYGDEVYDALKACHDPRYGGFSRLLRKTFDEALDDFADGGIDLLHIDGLHTYEAVRHDFESWLPKMSPRGVVLFHDTQVQENGFGVWKLWRELESRYPSFEFEHGYGLGVIATGSEPPPGLRPFFDASPDQRAGLRDFFQRAGRFHLKGSDAAMISSLQNDLRRRDAEISRMKASASWRLTKPLRLLSRPSPSSAS